MKNRSPFPNMNNRTQILAGEARWFMQKFEISEKKANKNFFVKLTRSFYV